jgi:hypothetical protein
MSARFFSTLCQAKVCLIYIIRGKLLYAGGISCSCDLQPPRKINYFASLVLRARRDERASERHQYIARADVLVVKH